MEQIVSLVSINDVHFSYGAAPILRGISLDICAGDIVGVVGPNGAGKSTLLRILAGALAPAQGSVALGGTPLARLPLRDRARRIAVVPQETHIPFPFCALEVVLMGRAPHLPPFGFESPRDLDVARAAMAATDCGHLAAREIHTLSGGERQRVLLARALAQEPELLLLDEPTTFLDLCHQAALHRVLSEQNRARKTTIVAAMHDLNLAAALCHRIVMLREGRVAVAGSPIDAITAQTIETVFGVPVTVTVGAERRIPFCIPKIP